MVKQTEGKHNLYIDMLKERQSTMENDILIANIPKNFYEIKLEAKLKKCIKW